MEFLIGLGLYLLAMGLYLRVNHVGASMDDRAADDDVSAAVNSEGRSDG